VRRQGKRQIGGKQEIFFSAQKPKKTHIAPNSEGWGKTPATLELAFQDGENRHSFKKLVRIGDNEVFFVGAVLTKFYPSNSDSQA